MVVDEAAAGTIVTFGGGSPRPAGGERARPVARRRPAALGLLLGPALLGPALLASCVRSTSISYLPNAERPRLSLAEGESMLARYLSIECQQLLGRSVATGQANVIVAVDSLGNVTTSQLERSTGDPQADGLVGAVTSQLRLEALAPGTKSAVVRAGYRCLPDGRATTTLAHP